MKIACLSGKGGTGKTLVAVNLAFAAGNCTYVDCDVEEPNGRLFLKAENVKTESVNTLLPEFHADSCIGCKKCVEFCRFHALMYVREKPMVFAEVCHSCGGCMLVCPEGAITEREKPVGRIETGSYGAIKVVTGILNPAEASGVPVIRRALGQAGEMAVIDCPPGSACSVMESVMDADYCLLVTEPTAFGFHNFRMVYELVTLLGKPCGVIMNRVNEPYEPLDRFCEEMRLPVLGRIPYHAGIAAMAAEGQIVAEKDAGLRDLFCGVLSRIEDAL